MSTQPKDFYKLEIAEIEEVLQTNVASGLAKEDAAKRLEIYGTNVFKREGKRTLFDSLRDHLKNPLIYVLIAALVVTLLLREYLNMLAIVVALAINIAVGVVQEGRASRAFEKLADAQQKEAKVKREGLWRVIPASNVVPGDIVNVVSGMNVPADLRLIEAQDVLVDESLLTGEWKSVHKTTTPITEDAELTSRTNTMFMGSLIVGGHATGIAIGTGHSTEIGKIAKDLDAIETSETPAQKNINEIMRFLAKAAAVLVAFVVAVGLLQGREVGEAALVAIAIAVSALPEGLPASVTVVLALGMESIMQKGGLVKNLLAAETLGSTTIILTDKTGTLTQAKMGIHSLITASTLSGNSSLDEGGVISTDQRTLLIMALRSSDAYISETEGEAKVEGRPVERALLEKGIELSLIDEALKEPHERLDLLSFESKNRFAASLNNSSEGEVLYISGAPEVVLGGSSKILQDGEEVALTGAVRSAFLERLEKESGEGRRFIAIAYKPSSLQELTKRRDSDTSKLLDGSVFAGMVSLEDPVRPDVKEAIETATSAGTRVIMVTGDLAGTAKNIAVQVGIGEEDDRVVLGAETEDMSNEELLVALHSTTIFARVLPHQKLRISEVLKNSGEVVAMTGDGVNDAPALRNASIGIAVNSGTEVAKAASDLILIDNSFSVITAAIKEGRRIVDNLRKIIAYLLSTNLTECLAVVAALVIGLQSPLLAVQILWINIIGQAFHNFALALEPAEKGIMQRAPHRIGTHSILSKEVINLMLVVGITTGTLLVGLYIALLRTEMPLEDIRTTIFITFSLGYSLYLFSFRDLGRSVISMKPLSNPYIILSVAFSLFLIYLSVTLSPLQTLLSLTSPTSTMILIALLVSTANLVLIEAIKYFVITRGQNKQRLARVLK